MIQYLLNATAIWLISLLIFDVFLRRESFHAYNRAYLLGTFISGLIIPFISFGKDAVIYATGMYIPAEKVAIAKQNIIQSQATADFLLSWDNGLVLFYISGAVISLLYLFREIFVVTGYYRKGTKCKEGIWTIVETGATHTPFSFLNTIFLHSRKNYSEEELKIVIAHEQQHGKLLHFIDLLLMQIAKIIFWFLPLVHIYYRRLIILHEYQADAAIRQPADDYGHFLVEQAVLGSAPVITHSFNRSPIKKRILMLKRKNIKPTRIKQLLIFPLILLTVSCFKKDGIMDTEPIREGNKIAYKGIVFELAKPYEPDTVMVEDAVTKELTMMITTRTGPPDIIKMNGEEVFTNIHGADDAFYDLETQALNTIRKEIEPIVKKLPKGIYTFFIYNAIVTKEGKLVFYDIGGIEQSYKKTEDEPIIIPADMKKKIVDKMAMAMEKLEVSQYQKDDKPIHYNMRIAGNIKVD